jgi:hypothetical protein
MLDFNHPPQYEFLPARVHDIQMSDMFLGIRHRCTYTLCCQTTVGGSLAGILATEVTGGVLAGMLAQSA